MLLAKSLVAIGETGTTGTRVLHRVWLPPSLFELTEIERGVGGLPCYHCISAYPGTTGIRISIPRKGPKGTPEVPGMCTEHFRVPTKEGAPEVSAVSNNTEYWQKW
eukprot:3416991-Rhodomonas_salina.2